MEGKLCRFLKSLGKQLICAILKGELSAERTHLFVNSGCFDVFQDTDHL